MLGSTVDGKYRVIRLLGQGGMGAVYEATHTGTGRRVALKVITSDVGKSPDIIGRFQREARAAGAIESQHIVQVLDVGVDQTLGVPFMVMEFLNGEDVQQLCDRLGALPSDLALRLAAQACSGLQKAHEAGVVHRDIKPANLFVSRRDDGELVLRLLDFGIAKVKMDQLLGGGDQAFTRTGSMLGSPIYMSPEQAMGLKTVDHRTDLWSLGAVLYEALAGRTPHHGNDTLGKLIMAICTAPPEPIQDIAPWVAPEVAAIIHRALRLDAADRFQSAAEMRESIRAILPGGFGLTNAMLMPLQDAERQHVAARFHSNTAPDLRVSAAEALPVSGGTVVMTSTAAAGAITGNPFTSTRQEAPRATNKAALGFLGVVIAAAAIGGGVWFNAHRTPSASPALSASVSATSTSAESNTGAASVTVAPAPVAVAPALRTVRLQISPANAVVEVDGAAQEPRAGFIEIQGPLGSVHAVHAKVGKRESSEQVVIAESGPLPPRIDLGAAVPAAKRAPAAAAAPPPPPPAARPAPAAAPAPAKALKSTGLTVDKQFQ